MAEPLLQVIRSSGMWPFPQPGLNTPREDPALTVILQHSSTRELNRIEYSGAISTAEMVALAEYQIRNPGWLGYDVFNLIAEGTDFSRVRPDDLDAIVVKYRDLFEPSRLVIFRRSAWLSFSPQAQSNLDHWIARRNTRQSQTLDARQFANPAEAAAWLAVPADKAAELETGEGFEELARYDLP